MTNREAVVDQLILNIHSAVLTPHNWPTVVRGIRDLHQADSAQLFCLPPAVGEDFWHVPIEFNPEVNAAYAVEYSAEDVWLKGARRRGLLIVGNVTIGEELLDRQDFLASRFYNELLVPYDLDRILQLTLPGPPSSVTPTTLSLYRGDGRMPFGYAEKELLQRLAPHLVVALSTYWAGRANQVTRGLLGLALDAVTAPLVLIEYPNRIVFSNNAAERELRSGDFLRSIGGFLEISPLVREKKAASKAIAAMFEGLSETVPISMGAASRLAYLSAAPLDGDDLSIVRPRSRGLVWLSPTRSTGAGIRRLSRAFLLTPAETRLLTMLADGSTLGQAAQKLGISIHTSRSQLKAIQRKTGWRSQAEIQRMAQQFCLVEPQSTF